MSIDPTEIPPETAERARPPATSGPDMCQTTDEHGRPLCVRQLHQRPCATCPDAPTAAADPAEAHTRREWAAALRYVAALTVDPAHADAWAATAGRIEAGELTPWADAPARQMPDQRKHGSKPPGEATASNEPDCLRTAAEVRARGETDCCGHCGYPAAAHPGAAGPDCDTPPAGQGATGSAAQPNPGTVAPLDRQGAADIPALVAMPDLTDRERADFLAAAAELDGKPAGLDLDAIEARVNAATPGPWRTVWGSLIARGVEITESGTYRAIQDVAEIPDDRCEWESDEAVEVSAEADAEFIAAARADVPALVAEVRRLERIIAETDSLAEVERDRAMAELAGLRASLPDRDRRTAADALDAACGWLPKTCPQIVKKALAMFAREVRAGTRTIPTTTEGDDRDAH